MLKQLYLGKNSHILALMAQIQKPFWPKPNRNLKQLPTK